MGGKLAIPSRRQIDIALRLGLSTRWSRISLYGTCSGVFDRQAWLRYRRSCTCSREEFGAIQKVLRRVSSQGPEVCCYRTVSRDLLSSRFENG